jgi:hypothetical protein
VYISVKELPQSLLSNLRSIGYRKADIELVVEERFDAPMAYGAGHQAQVLVVNLATGQSTGTRGSWGGSNPFEKRAIDVPDVSSPLPPGFAALTSGMRGHWRLHLNPANAVRWLEGAAEVTPREQWILGVFAGFKPRGRRDEFERYRYDYGDAGPPGDDEMKSLIARGYIKQNRAGATSLTTLGKNNAGKALRRPKFVPRAGILAKDITGR